MDIDYGKIEKEEPEPSVPEPDPVVSILLKQLFIIFDIETSVVIYFALVGFHKVLSN